MKPGKIGRYAIVSVVSCGQDEDVLLGEQGSKRVAIRVLHGRDREGILQDARRVAALSHPNVAHQEVGLHEDALFLAAEIPGESLTSWAAQPRDAVEQLQVIGGVASGLAHAHAHDVVHGRLAPERIAVGPDGIARIWGFGFRGAAPERASAYTAPEVSNGSAATAAADVYSSGVLFYELLAGETPRGEAPTSLSELRRDVQKDLTDAIMACRERSTDWRPKDLGYLIEVVRRVRGPLPASRPAAAERTAVSAPRLRTEPPSSKRLLPVAVGVVVFLGGAAALYLRDGAPPSVAASPPAPTQAIAAVAPPSATATPLATRPATPAPLARPSTSPAPTTAAAASPRPAVTPRAPTPVETHDTPPATPAPTPATAAPMPPPVTSAPAATATASPPVTPPAAVGRALLRTISPPTLRRGQRTLVDVRGRGLHAGLAAGLLRAGRPAEGLRVLQQRFVDASLMQVFIDVDASTAPGAYGLVLSDGRSATNAVRFDVAK